MEKSGSSRRPVSASHRGGGTTDADHDTTTEDLNTASLNVADVRGLSVSEEELLHGKLSVNFRSVEPAGECAQEESGEEGDDSKSSSSSEESDRESGWDRHQSLGATRARSVLRRGQLPPPKSSTNVRDGKAGEGTLSEDSDAIDDEDGAFEDDEGEAVEENDGEEHENKDGEMKGDIGTNYLRDCIFPTHIANGRAKTAWARRIAELNLRDKDLVYNDGGPSINLLSQQDGLEKQGSDGCSGKRAEQQEPQAKVRRVLNNKPPEDFFATILNNPGRVAVNKRKSLSTHDNATSKNFISSASCSSKASTSTSATSTRTTGI
ncbi:unnamed protein product [Amoebophrya sp. A120]|nr:unnamed protein product [Amoebophrya sp. A120]|eukprot:GSA120T00016568001.1